MSEEWKEIPGFSKYEASSHGQVRRKGKDKVLSQQTKGEDGYKTVSNMISDKDGKKLTRTAHQLVALAFIPNPENKPTVHHKDNDRGNNHVSNLEWATMKEQNDPNNKPPKPYKRIIRQVWRCDMSGNKIEMYASIPEAAQAVGMSESAVKQCLQGRSTNCAGFKWIYDLDEDLPGEIWKPISPDFIKGGKGYLVSNKARVKNKYSYIHSQYKSDGGYIKVNIFKNDHNVHRLVAHAFIPNPDELPMVNHKDGNKCNNLLENLEWISPSDNVRHSYDTGLNTSNRRVFQYTITGKFVAEYPSATKAAEQNNFDLSSVKSTSLKNENKELSERHLTCYDFIWKYPPPGAVPADLKLEIISIFKAAKLVDKVDKDDNVIESYVSIKDASRKNNIEYDILRRYIKNKNVIDGFTYRYKDLLVTRLRIHNQTPSR
jgi:hypothetical protein